MKPIYIPLPGLLLALAGCVTVQLVRPAEFIQTRGPEVVWVTTSDQARIPVAQPQIVGDSLEGRRQGCPHDAVAISLRDISFVEARLPSTMRTALLLTVVSAATIGASFAFAAGVDRSGASSGCGTTKGAPLPFCPY